MKRMLFCLIGILNLCCNLYTQEYQLAEVEDIAISFLNRKSRNVSTRSNTVVTKQIGNIEAIVREGLDYMYIVNAENSTGWVIISNEKKYSTIIAHADSGSFVYNTEILPPALLCILEQHMDAIDSTRINNTINVSKFESNKRSAQVESLNIDTTSVLLFSGNRWKQEENNGLLDCERVYNKFVPASHDASCGRALVGCGAVAMAQIMKYWQWPDYAFIRDTIIAGVCSGSLNQRFYDWEHMPNFIDENTDIYEVDAVAGLLRDCAYAANTIFWGNTPFCDTCSSALIGNINSALTNVFSFHTNRVNESSGTDIESILRQEIYARRPVLCQAWRKDSIGDNKTGHSFVIVGYEIDSTGTRFAINMGGGALEMRYYNINFNGYNRNRTFLTEIYPKCEIRGDDLSFTETDNILANDNRTYYSTNDIVFCSNNNAITINNGGHLLVKSNGQVRLNSGFHAKAGSDVRITTTEALCYTSQTASTVSQNVSPRRITTADNSPNSMGMTNNYVEEVNNDIIQSTSIYTISGQLLQTIAGFQQDISNLPNGMYILQHRISDGSIISTKIIK